MISKLNPSTTEGPSRQINTSTQPRRTTKISCSSMGKAAGTGWRKRTKCTRALWRYPQSKAPKDTSNLKCKDLPLNNNKYSRQWVRVRASKTAVIASQCQENSLHSTLRIVRKGVQHFTTMIALHLLQKLSVLLTPTAKERILCRMTTLGTNHQQSVEVEEEVIRDSTTESCTKRRGRRVCVTSRKSCAEISKCFT